ncbi:MAG TPA: hypothetical protein VJ259_00705 [Actinomycetota bacterium]|nr:hypothetical protein [Actinomycetota bacterium]
MSKRALDASWTAGPRRGRPRPDKRTARRSTSTDWSRRRLVVAGAVAAAVAVLGATVLVLALEGSDTSPERATQPAAPSPSGGTTGAPTTVVQVPSSLISTSADPGDARALVREAVANVRALERFRFEMDVGGPAVSSHRATGEVDLSTGPGDPPRLRMVLHLQSPDGGTVTFEKVAIGQETYAKLPGQDRFEVVPNPSPQIGPAAPGGAATGGATADPVTPLLDSLAKLGREALGTPSRPDANGIRTVRVVAGGDGGGPEAVYVLRIDEQHLVREIRFATGGATSVIRLTDFGDPSIVIEAPHV